MRNPHTLEYFLLDAPLSELAAVTEPHIEALLDPDSDYYPKVFARTQDYVDDFNAKHPEDPYINGLAAMVTLSMFGGRVAFDLARTGINQPRDTSLSARDIALTMGSHAALRYAQDDNVLDTYLAMHDLSIDSPDFAGYYDPKARLTTYDAVRPLFDAAMDNMRHLGYGIMKVAKHQGWSLAYTRQVVKASRALRVIGAAASTHPMFGQPHTYEMPGDIAVTEPTEQGGLHQLSLSAEKIGQLAIRKGRPVVHPLSGEPTGKIHERSGCPMRYIQDPAGGTIFDEAWDEAIDYLLADGTTRFPPEYADLEDEAD